jgi:hypothetical protein
MYKDTLGGTGILSGATLIFFTKVENEDLEGFKIVHPDARIIYKKKWFE